MSWEEKLKSAWQELESLPPHEFLDKITKIVEDPTVPPEVVDFQIACANDSTGRPDLAVPGYRRAIERGLSGYNGRRAKIQLASSLRNLGQFEESVRILLTESTSVGDGLDDAVVVFHALALANMGRDREAVTRLVHALADHLPRYTASAHRYADALALSQEETANPSQEGTDR